jgi:hypothetical protein
MLKCAPPQLVFREVRPEREYVKTVTISNLRDTAVHFELKSSSPGRYTVTPWQVHLDSGREVEIKVRLRVAQLIQKGLGDAGQRDTLHLKSTYFNQQIPITFFHQHLPADERDQQRDSAGRHGARQPLAVAPTHTVNVAQPSLHGRPTAKHEREREHVYEHKYDEHDEHERHRRVDDDRDHGAEYEAEREGTPSPPQRRRQRPPPQHPREQPREPAHEAAREQAMQNQQQAAHQYLHQHEQQEQQHQQQQHHQHQQHHQPPQAHQHRGLVEQEQPGALEVQVVVDAEMRRERAEFERKSKKVLEILAEKDKVIAGLEEQLRASANKLAQSEMNAAEAADAVEVAEQSAKSAEEVIEQQRCAAEGRESELASQLAQRENEIFELNEKHATAASPAGHRQDQSTLPPQQQQQQQQQHSQSSFAPARALREKVIEQEEQVEVLLAEVSRLRCAQSDAQLPQQQEAARLQGEVRQLKGEVRQLAAVNTTLEQSVRESRRVFGTQADKFSSKMAEMAERASPEKCSGSENDGAQPAAEQVEGSDSAISGADHEKIVGGLLEQVQMLSVQLEEARSSVTVAGDGNQSSRELEQRVKQLELLLSRAQQTALGSEGKLQLAMQRLAAQQDVAADDAGAAQHTTMHEHKPTGISDASGKESHCWSCVFWERARAQTSMRARLPLQALERSSGRRSVTDMDQATVCHLEQVIKTQAIEIARIRKQCVQQDAIHREGIADMHDRLYMRQERLVKAQHQLRHQRDSGQVRLEQLRGAVRKLSARSDLHAQVASLQQEVAAGQLDIQRMVGEMSLQQQLLEGVQQRHEQDKQKASDLAIELGNVKLAAELSSVPGLESDDLVLHLVTESAQCLERIAALEGALSIAQNALHAQSVRSSDTTEVDVQWERSAAEDPCDRSTESQDRSEASLQAIEMRRLQQMLDKANDALASKEQQIHELGRQQHELREKHGAGMLDLESKQTEQLLAASQRLAVYAQQREASQTLAAEAVGRLQEFRSSAAGVEETGHVSTLRDGSMDALNSQLALMEREGTELKSMVRERDAQLKVLMETVEVLQQPSAVGESAADDGSGGLESRVVVLTAELSTACATEAVLQRRVQATQNQLDHLRLQYAPEAEARQRAKTQFEDATASLEREKRLVKDLRSELHTLRHGAITHQSELRELNAQLEAFTARDAAREADANGLRSLISEERQSHLSEVRSLREERTAEAETLRTQLIACGGSVPLGMNGAEDKMLPSSRRDDLQHVFNELIELLRSSSVDRNSGTALVAGRLAQKLLEIDGERFDALLQLQAVRWNLCGCQARQDASAEKFGAQTHLLADLQRENVRLQRSSNDAAATAQAYLHNVSEMLEKRVLDLVGEASVQSALTARLKSDLISERQAKQRAEAEASHSKRQLECSCNEAEQMLLQAQADSAAKVREECIAEGSQVKEWIAQQVFGSSADEQMPGAADMHECMQLLASTKASEQRLLSQWSEAQERLQQQGSALNKCHHRIRKLDEELSQHAAQQALDRSRALLKEGSEQNPEEEARNSFSTALVTSLRRARLDAEQKAEECERKLADLQSAARLHDDKWHALQVELERQQELVAQYTSMPLADQLELAQAAKNALAHELGVARNEAQKALQEKADCESRAATSEAERDEHHNLLVSARAEVADARSLLEQRERQVSAMRAVLRNGADPALHLHDGGQGGASAKDQAQLQLALSAIAATRSSYDLAVAGAGAKSAAQLSGSLLEHWDQRGMVVANLESGNVPQSLLDKCGEQVMRIRQLEEELAGVKTEASATDSAAESQQSDRLQNAQEQLIATNELYEQACTEVSSLSEQVDAMRRRLAAQERRANQEKGELEHQILTHAGTIETLAALPKPPSLPSDCGKCAAGTVENAQLREEIHMLCLARDQLQQSLQQTTAALEEARVLASAAAETSVYTDAEDDHDEKVEELTASCLEAQNRYDEVCRQLEAQQRLHAHTLAGLVPADALVAKDEELRELITEAAHLRQALQRGQQEAEAALAAEAQARAELAEARSAASEQICSESHHQLTLRVGELQQGLLQAQGKVQTGKRDVRDAQTELEQARSESEHCIAELREQSTRQRTMHGQIVAMFEEQLVLAKAQCTDILESKGGDGHARADLVMQLTQRDAAVAVLKRELAAAQRMSGGRMSEEPAPSGAAAVLAEKLATAQNEVALVRVQLATQTEATERAQEEAKAHSSEVSAQARRLSVVREKARTAARVVADHKKSSRTEVERLKEKLDTVQKKWRPGEDFDRMKASLKRAKVSEKESREDAARKGKLLAALRAERLSDEAAVHEWKSELKSRETELRRVSREAAHKATLVKETRAQLEEARASVEQCEAQKTELRAKLREAAQGTRRVQTAGLQQKIEEQEQEVAKLRLSLAAAEERHSGAVSSLKRDLSRKQSQLKAERGRLEATKKAFEAFKAAASEWEETSEGKLRELQSKTRKLSGALSTAEGESASAAQRLAAAKGVLHSVGAKLIKFKQDRHAAAADAAAAAVAASSAAAAAAGGVEEEEDAEDLLDDSNPRVTPIAAMLDLTASEMHELLATGLGDGGGGGGGGAASAPETFNARAEQTQLEAQLDAAFDRSSDGAALPELFNPLLADDGDFDLSAGNIE